MNVFTHPCLIHDFFYLLFVFPRPNAWYVLYMGNFYGFFFQLRQKKTLLQSIHCFLLGRNIINREKVSQDSLIVILWC